MEKKETEILEAAEKMVREGGYNGFSFREIAKEVGIKSSSVHYYFATKEDLGAAVVNYYTQKFIKYLGDPEELREKDKDPIETYVKTFKEALIKDQRMCLCGLLGAEIKGLPPRVVKETQIFFERNIEWLTQAYSIANNRKEARNKAIQTLALLEGAMILSNTLNNLKEFESAANLISKIT